MSKILLVDDNDNNRLTIELLLEEIEGVKIFEAADGQEAINMCEEHDFDLIFMDIMMPNVDGFEATETIKASGHKAMIIAISALDDNASKNKMLALGAEDYLTKPIDSDLFMIRIKNYFSIIEKRRMPLFDFDALNPFNKNVYKRSVNFSVKSEEALAEFWDYWLNDKKDITDLSDCVRIMYGFGLWMLKRKQEYNIIAEESEEKLYLMLTKASTIKKNIIRNLLLKHYKNAQYILDGDILSFQLEKKKVVAKIDSAKESVSISSESKAILSKTHDNAFSAVDYVNETAISFMGKIDGLEFINDEIDKAILEFEKNPSRKTLEIICDNFEEYKRVLQLLVDFQHLAFALSTLVNFLGGITQDQLEEDMKVKTLTSMLLNLLHDLDSWRVNIFIEQSARDIHYLDASLLSSCIQIEAVFEDKVVDEDDGGDLEFF